MTRREVFGCSAAIGLVLGAATLSCGAPAQPVEPAPPTGDVTVPEPSAAERAAAANDVEPLGESRPRSEPTVVPALASSIEDGYETHLMQRIKVAHDAEARAHLDDPQVSRAPDNDDTETLVVAAAPGEDVSAVRAVVDTNALRVLLWFDSSQVESVITETADLATTHKASRRQTVGVTAHPGLRVKRGAARGDRVQVTVRFEFPSPDSATITAQGWVDRNKLGYVYQSAPPTSPSTGKPSHVKAPTDVLAAPGGAVLANVGKGGGGIFFPVTILSKRGRMREILFAGAEIEVRGFVPESVLEELEPEGERGWGRGWGRAKLWQRWPKEQVRVPRGTCIYDAPGGEAIGVFKREHIENVVIPSDDSAFRAHRLPYGAVGHLYASDLIPVAKGEQRSISKEALELSAGSWSCPKRPD